MSFWTTEYPYTFTTTPPYYVPYAVVFEPIMLDDYKEIFRYIPADPETDINYRFFAIEKNTGTADIHYFMARDFNFSAGTATVTSTLIAASTAPFSFNFSNGVKYADTPVDYSMFATTYYNNDSFTYDEKQIFFRVLSVVTSFNDTETGVYTWASECTEYTTAQQAVLAANAQYFAWLTEYDSIYTNDPYNRPPEGDEPRGGDGTWDNYSDTITIDPLPAGLWGQGFVSVYCPTVAQLTNFANEIWKTSNREHLNDIFPGGVTSGIVSCHTLPVSPATSGSGKIVIGGYPIDNTSAAILSNRFVMVDFGSIPAKYTQEYFGAFVDYLNTKIALYLPYIGFVPLAPEMVINAVISLKYKIDCFTGDCIAIVTTNRTDKFNYQGMSYMFAGNCATQIPITSQTGAGTSDIISTAVSGLATIAGSALSGNPIGVVAGAVNTVNSIVADTSKIGFSMRSGFSGAKGQLSNQRPYLIINRPVMENGAKNNYFNLCGIPSNDYVTLGEITGYVQVMEAVLADTDFANATENEKTEILTALKGGIYI